MYRIFCESYQNYINSFEDDNSRLRIVEPLNLIVNLDIFKSEKKNVQIYIKSFVIYFTLWNKTFNIIQNSKHFYGH